MILLNLEEFDSIVTLFGCNSCFTVPGISILAIFVWKLLKFDLDNASMALNYEEFSPYGPLTLKNALTAYNLPTLGISTKFCSSCFNF